MSDKPVIAITGANGFIGSYLVGMLREKGYRVIAFSREPQVEADPGVAHRRFDLAAQDEPINLAGCDVLVHCAYAKVKNAAEADAVNLAGTRRLYEAAKKAGMKRFLFLSSLSAHEGAISQYGRIKLAIEKMLDVEKDLILRPGLTLGHGGVFGNILRAVQRSWVIPLVDGGRQRMQGIDIEDLGACLLAALERDITGSYTLIADEDFTLREMAQAIREKSGRRVPFVTVPYGLVNLGLALVEFLRLPTPVRRENLLGLKQNIRWETGDCERVFGVAPMPFTRSVERLSKEKI